VMPVCFSNSMPMSSVVQWQYGHERKNGPAKPPISSAVGALGGSRELTVIGDVHSGQL